MRAIWYQIEATCPESASSFIGQPGNIRQPSDSWLNRAIQWLRLKPAYQNALHLLSWKILPFGLLIVLVYLVAAFAWKLLFWWDLAKEAVCISAESPVKVARFEKGNSFRTDALCHPTRLMLEKGASYRIHVAIPSSHPWTDDGLPAGPEGLNLQASGWLTKLKMGLAVPLRRHLGQPWFMPMVRIGPAWTQTYPLDPKPPLASSPGNNASSSNACDETATRFPSVGALGQHYTAEIVARSGGELFVYVNDAIVGWPLAVDHFYRNNTGVGCIAVERIDPGKPPNE